ncbi:MAG: ABC transporter substrate-binding protein [Myxococcota bacterium]
MTRSKPHALHALAALAIGGLAAACSLTVSGSDSCSQDSDCRLAFGWGSSCQSDGYCSAVQTHPRCSRTYPENLFEEPESYRNHVLLGGLYSYEDHLDTLQGSELALRTVRSSDAFELDYAWVVCDYTDGAGDNLDTLEATREVTSYLAEDLGVPAIIGPRGSSRTQAAFEVASPSGTLVISPSATSPALTALDVEGPTDENPGLLWRTAPPDSLQSVVIASDLVDRGVASVAIIAQEGSYGDSLATLLQEEFLARGGTSATIETYSTDLFDAIADTAATDSEEVVFISSELDDYVSFLRGAVASENLETEYDAKGIFLPDAAFNEVLLNETVDSSEVLFDNIRGSRPAIASGPLFDAFTIALADEFGASASSSGFTAHAFDAAWLVLYATVWAHTQEGGVDGLGIARGLRQVSGGTEVEIRIRSWESVVELFSAGQAIDVSGASGSLNYDPSTEETTAPIEVWSIVADKGASSGYDFAAEYLIEP